MLNDMIHYKTLFLASERLRCIPPEAWAIIRNKPAGADRSADTAWRRECAHWNIDTGPLKVTIGRHRVTYDRIRTLESRASSLESELSSVREQLAKSESELRWKTREAQAAAIEAN
jgi:hypothetical protein